MIKIGLHEIDYVYSISDLSKALYVHNHIIHIYHFNF